MEMAIFRTNKENGHFTMISNKAIRSKNLSMKATGLLCYILSNSDEWEIHKNELSRHFTDGSTAFNNAFNELIKAGYIVVIKKNGADGRFKWVYDVYEDPDLNPSKGKTMSGDAIHDDAIHGDAIHGDAIHGDAIHDERSANNTNINNTNINKRESNLPSPKTLFDVIPVTKTVIEYLNEKADRHYRADTKDNISLVENLIKLGYTVEQIKYVIDVKVTEWKNDSKMRQYLRPSTLFRPSNFDRYLNQPMPARQLSKTQKMEGIDYNDLDRLHKIQKTSKKTDIVF